VCPRRRHLSQLLALVEAGRLQVAVDAAAFVGVGAVADAVDHLQSGASSGKVVVQVAGQLPAEAASRL